jgi:hypothetical protein
MNTLEKILVVPDPELNYNLCPGGHGGFGYINESMKIQMSEIKRETQKNKPKSYYSDLGKKSSEGSSKRMKKLHEEGKVRHDTFTGRKHTEETKQKMRKSKNVGQNNPSHNTQWITNKTTNRKISLNDTIPKGWYKGRVML